MNGGSIRDTEYSINNVYLDGVRVASLEPSGAARYFLTDQVDSVKITADSVGKVVSRTEYYPYGETWFSEGVEDIAPKYNGQELDQESDFYYFNARHYDPELARFVTADVIVDGEDSVIGWNRYAYSGNNPINYKDPTGHHKVKSTKLSNVNFNVENTVSVGSGGKITKSPSPPASKTEGNLGGEPNKPKDLDTKFLVNSGTEEKPELRLIVAKQSHQGTNDNDSEPRLLEYESYAVEVTKDKQGNVTGLKQGEKLESGKEEVIFSSDENPEKKGQKEHSGTPIFNPQVVTGVSEDEHVGEDNKTAHDVAKGLQKAGF